MSKQENKQSGTWIHGNASNEHVDTSGEIVSLVGLDCESLINSPFNWEHNSQPNHIVGKILDYKKIFSEKDCENEHHKYFWDKCKKPFLYIMGRLFDDKKDSSKEVAGLFIDDAEHPDEKPMVGFSIEGSTILKEGMVIVKSIARKCTICVAPANKQCIAQLIPAKKSKESDEDSLFKSDSVTTISLTKTEKPLQKQEVKNKEMVLNNGKKVHEIHGWTGISKPGKNGTGEIHYSHPKDNSPVTIHQNPNTKNYDVIHAGAPANFSGKKGLGHKTPKEAFDHAHGYIKSITEGTTAGNRMHNTASPQMNTTNIKKAMSAGSGMAAPSNLVGGAALSKESLDKKMKKSLLKRAEQEYAVWTKKERFESYMAKTMPHLTKYEIKALGQTIVLNKSLKAEKKLAQIAKNMANTMDKTEETPIKTCGCGTNLTTKNAEFIGTQKTGKNTPHNLNLYNCPNCHTTVSHKIPKK